MDSPRRITKSGLIARVLELERELEAAKKRSMLNNRLLRRHKILNEVHRRDVAALRVVEQRQALILRSLPMTVYAAKTSHDFGITWITENSQRVTGFPPDQFVASSSFWASRIHPDDQSHVLNSFAQIGLTGFISVEYRWQCADGQFHWFLDQALLVNGSRRQPKEIIGTWLDISRRKRLQKEVLEISEREQRRIGHDLHDDLCQQLASIEFLSHALCRSLAGDDHPASRKASEIARLVRNAITHTRELARGLSPVEIEADGLMLALQRFSARVRKMTGSRCQFLCHPAVLIRDNATSTHLYRIAQEAVTNAVKHGRARNIQISLSQNSHRVILEVRDDGLGLPSDLEKVRGMGFATMRYRAETMGGTLDLKRADRRGALVICSVPLNVLTRQSS